MVKIDKKMKQLIQNGTVALATCNLQNRPNVVAVACCKVVGDNQILATDNFMNKSRINLLTNPEIALAVWSADGEEGYQFKGKVQYLTTGKWKKIVDQDPENEGWSHKAAVLVTVEEIWDLASPHLICKV